MEHLTKCFDKHSFEELNNIDIQKLKEILQFVLEKCAYKGEVIFDVGCNAGSFVKAVKEKLPYAYIHAFEPHPILAKKVKTLYPSVDMHEMCLGDKNGRVNIQYTYVELWN